MLASSYNVDVDWPQAGTPNPPRPSTLNPLGIFPQPQTLQDGFMRWYTPSLPMAGSQATTSLPSVSPSLPMAGSQSPHSLPMAGRQSVPIARIIVLKTYNPKYYTIFKHKVLNILQNANKESIILFNLQNIESNY